MNYNRELAKNLPPEILFGTSSWTYPGWKGKIYQKQYKSEKQFKSESLAEYCEFPWFRTVGIDSSFYGPLKEKTLCKYAEQVPKDFKWVSKVWERITVPVYAKHPRYGALSGKENPDFLNTELFKREVLAPYEKSGAENSAGPFVFQFQYIEGPMKNTPQLFFNKLDKFFENIPSHFLYATEIRNKEFICDEYFQVLNKYKATHCFNHWSYMPPLVEQMKAAANAGGLASSFYLSRILTPLGLKYADAVKRFQPYEELKTINESMRADVVKLAKRAIQKKAKAYIIVNNRAEGHSPGTISGIGENILNLD